jgi:uncharacterized protein
MAANLPPQYYDKEAELKNAKTLEEKISILEQMLAIMPKHKSSEKIQALIKSKISKYRRMLEKSPQVSKKPTAPVVEREGNGQVAVCGPPNAGKSMLISFLTEAKAEVADYPFSTKIPMPGMMKYKDITIQLLDTPPLSCEFYENWLGDILRKTDALVFIFDISSDFILEEMEDALQVLETFKIKKPQDFSFNKKFLWLANKIDKPRYKEIKEVFLDLYGSKIPAFTEISVKEQINMANLPEKIFYLLGIMRIYTKIPGKEADFKNPYTLTEKSNLTDLAGIIHKDLLKNFKYARLWRKGDEKPVIAGRNYVLEDKDVVEIHT